MSSIKVYIGVDPGKSGSMAIMRVGKTSSDIRIIPFDEDRYVQELYMCLRDIDIHSVHGLIERVHAMPHDGGKGAFSFGENYGFIRGLFHAYSIPYETTPPQVWKKQFSLTGKDKDASVEVCKHLFPKVSLKKTDKSRKDDDGMAEALLIAEFCRRKFG